MPTFSIPLSGLTASSIALSAIANNLANLNTVGYKDTRVLFRDLFYQSLGTSGAGDPIQLGAGTAVSSMPAMFTQGSVDPSGVPTDVAIMGDGFFAVQKDGITSYTRAGNFSKDKDGFLVTAEGEQVMGYPAINGAVDTGQGLVPLQLGSGMISPPTATSTIQLRSNLDATAPIGTVFPATIGVYDSLGATHILTFNFTKTASNAWNYSISIPAAEVGATGNPVVVKTGALTFDGNGNIATPAGDVTGIAVTGLADGASDLTFDWKLYDGTSGLVTQVATRAGRRLRSRMAAEAAQ